ncbi:hypothetical protein AAG570_011274 [Ranatra chinensis]|uniref:Reverse transcriptase domain-containing protein n=1 Tax=Ranatra chinensis TaxID=642074 RepID=A0ABD0YKF0_9HEMI
MPTLALESRESAYNYVFIEVPWCQFAPGRGTGRTYTPLYLQQNISDGASLPSPATMAKRKAAASAETSPATPQVPVSNSFELLANAPEIVPDAPKKEFVPPIVLNGKPANITQFITDTRKVTEHDIRVRSNGRNTKIIVASRKDYQKVYDLYKERNVQFFSFAFKDDHLKRFVLHDLPETFTPEVILAELKRAIPSITSVSQMTKKLENGSTRKLPLFVVTAKKDVTIQSFSQVRAIFYHEYKVEKFRSGGTNVVQCYKCQNFGHTNRFCNMPERCVRCGQAHSAKECKETILKCPNCSENHSAGSLNCKVRHLYIQRNVSRNSPKKVERVPAATVPPITINKRAPAKKVTEGLSFSEVLGGTDKSTRPAQVNSPTAPSVGGHSSAMSDFIKDMQIINRELQGLNLLQMTHLKPHTKLYTPGYITVRNDRVGRNGGGVAILLKESIPFRQIDLPTDPDGTETLGIKVILNNRSTTIINVYNPPNVVLKECLLRNLFDYRGTVIVAGDFNARHRLWHCIRKNANGATLYDFVMNRGATLFAPETPTYVPSHGKGSQSTLDLVLANSSRCISSISTLTEGGSDHLPVYFELWGTPQTQLKKPRFDFRRTDWDVFRCALNNVIPTARPPLGTATDIDTAVVTFTEEITAAVQASTPTSTPRPQKLELPEEILDLIRDKNKVRRLWQVHRRVEDKRAYNRLHKEVQSRISQWRSSRWDELLRNVSPQDNSLWKLTRRLNRQGSWTTPTLRTETTTATTDLEKAELLAKHFAAINNNSVNRGNDSFNEKVEAEVRRLITGRTNSQTQDASEVGPNTISSPKHATPREIEKIIKKLKNNKSPGSDGIPNTVLKHFTRKALVKLTNITNAILKHAYYPTHWKTATVIALPKPGKPTTEPSSYRPISLLSSLAKVVDRIILNRLTDVGDKMRIIPDNQFGFRRNHATIHQLSRVVSHISGNMAKRNITAMVLLDSEKAFDTVWIEGLIQRLATYSFPSPLIKLVSSYLTDREIKVRVGNKLSAPLQLAAGLPQGSVMSPWLFNIYTSHLLKLQNSHVHIAGFADDLALYSSSVSAKNAINRVRNATHHMIKELNLWKINVNAAKSEAILFTPSRKQVDTHIHIRTNRIPFSSSVKYLGVHIDNKLNWNVHTKTTNKLALSKLGRNYCLFRSSEINSKHKLLLYKAIVRPTLTYGCQVWHTVAETHLQKLQITQNKCIRLASGQPIRTNTLELHKRLNIPTLKDFIEKMTDKFKLSLLDHPNVLTRNTHITSKAKWGPTRRNPGARRSTKAASSILAGIRILREVLDLETVEKRVRAQLQERRARLATAVGRAPAWRSWRNPGLSRRYGDSGTAAAKTALSGSATRVGSAIFEIDVWQGNHSAKEWKETVLKCPKSSENHSEVSLNCQPRRSYTERNLTLETLKPVLLRILGAIIKQGQNERLDFRKTDRDVFRYVIIIPTAKPPLGTTTDIETALINFTEEISPSLKSQNTIYKQNYPIFLNYQRSLDLDAGTPPSIILRKWWVHTGQGHKIARTRVLHSGSSDHLPVYFQVQQFPEIIFPEASLQYHLADWNLFRESLNDATSTAKPALTTDQDIDDAVEKFTSDIVSSLRISVPKKTTIIKPPVLPDEIKRLISTKNRVRRRWQKYRERKDKALLNVLERNVKTKILEWRNTNWEEKIQKINSLDGSLWKLTRSLTRKSNGNLPGIRTPENTIVFDDKGKSEVLLRYFAGVHKEAAERKGFEEEKVKSRVKKTMEAPGQDERTTAASRRSTSGSSNAKGKKDARNNAVARLIDKGMPLSYTYPKPTCPKELYNIIKNLPSRKAPGGDTITNRTIKNLPRKCIVLLTNLINAILRRGYFPTAWKTAIVIPIQKPSKPASQPSSYRPISLLPTLSKITEKIILKRLLTEVQSLQIIPHTQFGFRHQHSTVDQLSRVVSSIAEQMSKGQSAALVILDSEKAFDSVWIEGLVYKLIVSGISSPISKLIHSFLINRKIRVKVGRVTSECATIPAGVPQGSVLSPTLFNLYTSDILSASIKGVQMAAFADDLALYSHSQSPKKLLNSSLLDVVQNISDGASLPSPATMAKRKAAASAETSPATPQVPVSNSFELLANAPEIVPDAPKKEFVPPIVLNGKPANITQFITDTRKVTEHDIRVRSNGRNTKIIVASRKDYQKVYDLYKERNVQFFSFAFKDDHLKRFVLHDLPETFTPEVILAELKRAIPSITSVSQMTKKLENGSTRKLPLFVVTAKKDVTIQSFSQVRTIFYHEYKVEKFRSGGTNVVQCYKCQNFGHTNRFCNMPERCVRCGQAHSAKECKETILKCPNCSENHSAGSLNCKVRHLYIQRNVSRNSPKKVERVPAATVPPITINKRAPAKKVTEGLSFSEVLGGTDKSTRPAQVNSPTAPSVGGHSSAMSDFIKDMQIINRELQGLNLLQMTHLKPHTKLYTPGYITVRNDRVGRNGGGVAILLKESIPFRQIDLPTDPDGTETLGIKVILNNRSTTIINVYNPPNVVLKECLLRNLFDYRGTVIVAGDFNARHRLWHCIRKNANGATLYDFVMNRGATLFAPETPTYVPSHGKGSQSTLDLVLANSSRCISSISTLTEGGSDHLPVYFELWGTPQTQLKKPRFDFRRTDWDVFRCALNNVIPTARPPLGTATDIDTAVVTFTEEITAAVQASTPTSTPRPQKLELPEEILDLIRDKNKVRRLWQVHRRVEDKRAYNRLHKEVQSRISQWRSSRWDELLRNVSPQDNSLWKLTRRLNRQGSWTTPTLRTETTTATTDLEKAELLAKHFAAINNNSVNRGNDSFNEKVEAEVRRLITGRTNSQTQDASEVGPHTISSPKHATPREIEKIIKKLKNNKSPGSDGIPNTVLKHFTRKALVKLTNITNAILKHAYYPTHWKTATVIALPKPGKPTTEPSSYRPISLLSSLAKVVDRIILNRLTDVGDKMRIIPDNQFGFRRNHATIHQLSRVVSHISGNMAKRNITAMVLLDSEKAFDTVWIEGLIQRLATYSFPSPLIKLVSSYLTDREIKVRVGNKLSAPLQLAAGLPQGSVMSPWLFNIYTSHLLKLQNSHVHIAGFADDLALYSSSVSAKNAINRVRNATHHMIKELNLWKINVNAAKSEAILFTPSRKQVDTHIHIRTNRIPFSSSVKYLGVHIDNKLNWNVHTKTTNKLALSKLGRNYCLFRSSEINSKHKLLLYKAIVRPTLTYGCQVWHTVAETHLQKLQITQNKCIRLASGQPIRTNTLELHKRLNIPTLKDFIEKMTDKFKLSLLDHPNVLTRNTHITSKAKWGPTRRNPGARRSTLFSSRGTVIAAGDFNARHRLWGCQKKNKSGGVLYDFVMDRRAALVAPSNPTCVPCNGGTPSTLDLVLTNSHKCITDMRTVTEGGSDHLPVLFNIWGRAEANVKRPIYNFAQTDWDLFRRSLDLNIPTASPPLDTPSRIEAAVESLTREINEAIRISTPTKSQLPPRVELPREIVELIKLKNAVRRRWQSQRREEYKKMMNQLQRAVRDKIAEWKTERWNKMLQNTTTRDNTFWNLLRRFNRQCGRTNPTLRDGSEVASTNPEKATLLAKYFSGVNNQSTTRGNRSFVEQVDAQVRRILTAPPEVSPTDTITETPTAKLYKHTTPVEIREVLTKLKTNKAPGSDGITNKVAKNISRKALTKLTNIINAILRTCHYPRQWKTATVVALPKPGKLPSLPSSYRPISLLSVLAKITDKIILSRLLRVTEALDIIPDSQFGFRRKHATTHQLSRVVSHVSEQMKSGRSTAMVSLDCEKAYDTVWTNGLLFRLTEYNFPLPLIKIMQSYLSDRNIRVRIGESLSEEVSLQAGLPQGSVLSPWLFNIYTAHVLRSTTTPVYQSRSRFQKGRINHGGCDERGPAVWCRMGGVTRDKSSLGIHPSSPHLLTSAAVNHVIYFFICSFLDSAQTNPSRRGTTDSVIAGQN